MRARKGQEAVEQAKAIRQEAKRYRQKMRKAMPRVMAGFESLGDSALQEGVLPAKTKELIAIGIAMAKQCHYCIVAHVANALEAGATQEEILDVCRVAIMMGGGPAVAYSRLTMKAIEELEGTRLVSPPSEEGRVDKKKFEHP